jgi:hypothetical protein
MVDVEPGTATTAEAVPVPIAGSASSTSTRAAAWVFAVVEVVAFALWVSLGRTEWFHGDDWEFLAGRTAFDLDDLFTDHNTHWSTVPILAFRLLWWTFGIGSYVPYLVVVVALHLTAAALLRCVMLRSAVNPWIATAAASAFAFLGVGYQNIVWAFQVGFVGALVLGLVHMLLADHDGAVDRRDWLGLAAGLGALMSAGVGVTLVGATALAVLIRRGWRPAVLHSAPLGAVYLIWWFTIARHTPHPGVQTAGVGIGDLWSFTRTGLQQAFESLAQSTAVAVLLGVLLVVGLTLAWAGRDRYTLRRIAALPVALAVGAVSFLVFSGYGRVGLLGPGFARSPRYQHVVVALLLPILAVALAGLARRARFLTPVVCVLLLIGVPGNIETLADYTSSGEDAHRAYRRFILSIPRSDHSAETEPEVRPDTSHSDHTNITVGWLLAGAASGRIPDPGPISSDLDAAIRFHLSLLEKPSGDPPSTGCRTADQPITRRMRTGDAIHFEGPGALLVTPASSDVVAREEMIFASESGSRLVAVLGPIDITLQQRHPLLPVTVCPVPGPSSASP